MPKKFYVLYFYFLTPFLLFNTAPQAGELDQKTFLNIQNAVYEITRPLGLEAQNVTYKEPINFDALPYHLKKDRTLSFGTAFAIDSKHLVTAAHVLTLEQQAAFIQDYRIKDQQGNFYAIDKITRFSQLEDYVVFTLKQYPQTMTFLKTGSAPQVGESVWAVGNALGQGIVQREGRVSSFTSEENEGKWKYIRFTAPASPGNSGGPLVNSKGQVIGIVVKKSEDENLNYAVPIALMQNDDGKKARFYSRDLIETESHEQLFSTWEESFPLPKDMVELSNLATASFIAGIKQRRAAFEKKYNDAIFPHHKNIEPYLRVQSSNTQFITIEKDTGGSWSAHTFTELKEISLSDDQNIYFGFSNVSLNSLRMEAYVTKPKNMTLNDFISDPKIYFDTIIKNLRLQINIAEQRLVIASLGKALKTETWDDVYGRRWTSTHWGFSPFDIVITAHCLPEPQGVACSIRSNPSWASGYEQFYQAILAKRTTLGYQGTFKQWKEFLALPNSQKPKTLHSLSIDQLNISQTAKPKFSFSLPRKLNDDDVIEVLMELGLDLQSEDIAKLSVTSKDKKTYALFEGVRIYQATPKNNKKEKAKIKELFAKKYPYDGTQYEQDSVYVQHAVNNEKQKHYKNIESILFFSCLTEKKLGKKASKKLCEEFIKLNQKP